MRLMKASAIIKRPVVTMRGEDIAQVKDIVYAAHGGAVGGFTLAGRGMFAGPMKLGLTWRAVVALGADAVMISDESALEATSVVFDAAASGRAGGDVLGSQVLTDSGVELGTVIDVIVAASETVGGQCDVVGYEIEASEALGTKGTKLLIPLPDTIAASGEHLMVPASAKDFVAHDLAGFGAAVTAFRAQLDGAV
jgi:sporulation protein YlmC with PRC-barrel domain